MALLVQSARAAEASVQPLPVATLERKTPVDFEAEVLPVLRDNCLACHNRTRAKADLVLETPADILKGGENGPAVVPGDAKASLLLQAAAHQSKPVMPPTDNKVSAVDLTPPQLGLIRLLIEQGAKGGVPAPPPTQWQSPSASVHSIYSGAI